METGNFKELLALGRGAALKSNQKETFMDAFLRQVEKTPDATAVVDEYGSITYRELDGRSDHIAAELQKAEVKIGDFIAVKLPRVKEFVVAVIGIWKAGGAYMPVDPSYPEERIRYLLEDSGAKLTIDLDWLEKLHNQMPTTLVQCLARPEGVAILMYTSGSTGRPKGVLLLHRSLSAMCSWVPELMEYDSMSKVAEVPSFSFVGSCPFLYAPLVSGSEIHIISDAVRSDLSRLNDYIIQEGIRQVCLVSGLARAFLQSFHPENLIIMTGGEAVNGIDPGIVKLIAVYGMSETLQAISVYVITGSDSISMIGHPAPGVTMVLEDEEGIPVPRGKIGEVCIASPQVAAGYWHNEELTSKNFVERPWSRYKMFRSGDLARWNENGELEFHGRKDNMVKIRGNRVELGEVEAALLQVKGVSAGAVAMKEVGGESMLCGYYVSSEPVSSDFLRASMSKFLPLYMIPSFFVRMGALPKLPNGKLDRLSLPVPDMEASRETVAPQSGFERKVFPIVAREVGTENFGVTTNLISLGLTSLRAIRLSAVLKSELGLDIPQAEMLAHPSIREWEALSRTESDTVSVEPPRGFYPLTDSQTGIYVEWEQNRESDCYNLPSVIKIAGGDALKLFDCVKEAVARYPILKTHIAGHDGTMVQMRRDDAQLTVGFEHLGFEPDEDFFRKLVRPFDLSGGDLARFNVYSSPQAAWLFFDVHHIIFDGGSANVFMKTLSSIYGGRAVPSETVTLYDYALYKENRNSGKVYEESGRYYEALLEGTESFRYPSSSGRSADGRMGLFSMTLSRPSVRAFCHQCGVTENSFFATVLTQVFHRVSREGIIQMAMFSSGRSMTELSGSIGMFVRTLPLVSHAADGTVGETLRSIHSQIVETLARDRYPYTLLSERFGVKPNVMYVYQGDLIDNVDFGGAECEWHRLPVSSAISPLTVEILPEAEEYRIKFEYDGGLYEDKDMESLSGAVRTLAEEMAGSADAAPLGGLSMVTEEEKVPLLSLGTGEKMEYDRNETFIDQFRRTASQYPDSVAIVDSTSSITYRELNEKSNILAARLIELGVRKDTFVAVMLPRVKEFVVAVLSVWKAGGAYLPLGSEYPKERLKFMLEDAEAGIMITESGIWSEMSGAGLPAKTVLKLDEFDFSGSAAPVNNAVADGLAYMIYTSGSTGKPKGTMLEHRNLRAFNQWLVRSGEIGAGDAISVHASFSFDGSCLDLYPALTVGGQVHILSKEVREDMSLMDKYFRENHIKGCFLTARLAGELLNSFDLSLDYLMAGGEKVVPFRPCGVRVMNAYGPTECTILSTCGPIDQSFPEENIPLGRPVPNTYAVIVDASGNMVPRGMAGELCLCGPQIARGYWKRPELTAEKFCGCPFYPGERMYHTGDIAFWNEKGELVCLGRTDDQIKLRGFRIELGEIEAAMSSYPGILSAVSDVRTINGISHLCAWYVSKDEMDESSLRIFLSDYLTDYMVPESFVRMEKMPVTANMKVDRKALPNPELKADEIVPPRTERERQLFAVVSDELGTDQFGVTTNLLSMGLTSIRAIRLSMVIKNRLGLSISTGDILSRPRIRDWQESVSETIEVAELREYYPLTDNQLGIYIDWEQHRDGLQYNVPSAMKFIGADADRMATALREVISNHPSLKTRIVQVEEDVMQQRRDDAEIPVLFEHLEEEPSAAFFQSRVRPFNLLEDDLARFEVYQTKTAAYLFYDIHHIIFDGGAANVLLSDLTKILSGTGIEPEKVSAFDYALYYDEWKRSDKYVEYGKYFDGLVSDTESFLYPVSSTGQSSEGESATLAVSVPLDKIRSFCRGSGITENAYFATVLTQVFHRISREDSILITTISSGRSMVQLSETMGMFVQTLPLVSRSSRGTVSDILRDMQSQIVETVRRDKYPFTRLSERHGIRPNVLYAYQGDVIDNGILSGIEKVEIVPLSLDTAKMPISVNVFPESGNYSLTIEYDAGMYSEEDMKLLGNALSVFATSLAGTSPKADISSVGLTAPSEVASLTKLGVGEVLEYDRNETFIDIFLPNVSAVPDALAVVDSSSSLTYCELDAISDALAAKLVSEGVIAGDFVAVKMPRVKEFIVAVLGIWKAGAAYVPIDPEYPEERINYMLEDSGAKVIIDEKYCSDIAAGNTKPLNLSRPEDPAYLIYTSGSTGKPKGTEVTHSNVTAYLAWITRMLDLKQGDNIGTYVSFSFDGSLSDLYPSLACGCTLHILFEDLRRDLPGMHEYFKKNRIKGLDLMPQIAAEMLNTFDLNLDYILAGGERVPQFRPSKVKVFNVYGPTECTNITVCGLIDQKFPYNTIPIGRPVPGTTAIIMDSFGNMVPRGMAGELCLAGSQVSKGYWHRPELTSEVFVPCKALGGATIYRTGDLVRWNGNGELEYLGRIDHQVKLRGFRIEMGEIEAALSKFDGIASAVAEVKTANGIQHLCAYYVADVPVDEDALKSKLTTSLAAYMVPDVYIRMEALPMAPNGKVDRKVLPEPKFKPAEMVPAITRNEKILLRIAREMLGTDTFGVTDSLVDYGMTSISAIKFVAAASNEHISLKVGDVLQNPTIRAAASKDQALGYWHHPYEESRPVMVFTSGITTWLQAAALLDTLSKHYNVFVFEVLQDHFDVIFSDDKVDNVILLYSAYLEQMLPEGVKVTAFAGHSFGGKLAVRMASEYSQETGEVPDLYLWDTWLTERGGQESTPAEKQLDAFLNATDDQMDIFDEQIKCAYIIGSLKNEASALPVFTGHTTYFRALGTTGDIEANRLALSVHLPNLRIIDIDADHFSILSAEKSEECLGKV